MKKPTKPKIFYKVVANVSGNLFSANAFYDSESLRGNITLAYHPNERIVPKIKGSGIFVFNELGDAKQFAAQMHSIGWNSYEVWSAECQNPSRLHIRCNSLVMESAYPLFWKGGRQRRRLLECGQYASTPTGTWVADSVILKKFIRTHTC